MFSPSFRSDELAELGIPFMFVTGYGRSGLGGRYPDASVLAKPYSPRALADVLTIFQIGRTRRTRHPVHVRDWLRSIRAGRTLSRRVGSRQAVLAQGAG